MAEKPINERPPAEADNLLDYSPQPAVLWETDDKGLVTLKCPRIGQRYLQKVLLPRLKNPYLLIHLDAMGSSVWQQMDGAKTVAEIGLDLRKEFGEAVEPVYERLGLFIRLLLRRKFITLNKWASKP